MNYEPDPAFIVRIALKDIKEVQQLLHAAEKTIDLLRVEVDVLKSQVKAMREANNEPA